MRQNIILTLTGPDRIGIVEAVTGVLLEHGGNVETSRMARLGGEFAMLLLVSLPGEKIDNLEDRIRSQIGQAYRVTASQTQQADADRFSGWLPYQIEVRGADHEGIVHQVARHLSQCGINIETMDTEVVPAPMSGTPLFAMTARVAVPPGIACQDWQTSLEDVGCQLNVDIAVTAADLSSQS